MTAADWSLVISVAALAWTTFTYFSTRRDVRTSEYKRFLRESLAAARVISNHLLYVNGNGNGEHFIAAVGSLEPELARVEAYHAEAVMWHERAIYPFWESFYFSVHRARGAMADDIYDPEKRGELRETLRATAQAGMKYAIAAEQELAPVRWKGLVLR